MSLGMLPNEVLAQVFLQVDDPSTLYDLALCSRRIHEIVEPVLYSVFRDVEGHDLALFLRTILAKPHLRKHVRTFDSCDGRYYFFRVTGAQMHDTEPLFSMDIFGQEDWSRLRAAIHSASLNDGQVGPWIDAIYRNNWEAVVALMLVILPRLEHLCLVVAGKLGWSGRYDSRVYFWTAMVLRCGWDHLPSEPQMQIHLKHLKEVVISPYDTEMPITMHQLLPYLKVKSVTEFKMDFLQIYEWETLDSNVFQTKDIELSCACLAPAAFRLFLQCFPNLERLSYEHDGGLASDYPLQPVLVGRALAHLRHCLRELILIDENPVTIDNLFSGATEVHISGDDVGPIGSLADYCNLEVLDTMYHILITPYYEEDDDIQYMKSQSLVDALPSSIRHLTVRYCPEDFIPHIHEFFGQVERFPRLTKLTVIFDRSGPEVKISESSMRIFREESTKRGIFLELQYLGVEEEV